jgi:hypothetical protein
VLGVVSTGVISRSSQFLRDDPTPFDDEKW